MLSGTGLGTGTLETMAVVLVGGYLTAGGANAINMWYDRDIDPMMKRTAQRPIPSGEISPNSALLFGVIISILGTFWLVMMANEVAAFWAAFSVIFYVLVYSIWLKRSTPQNIVIGGIAGSTPPLVGWAAAESDLQISVDSAVLFFESVTDMGGLMPWFMFVLIFLWTPPHFWALAIRYKDDYSNAEVPMLPVIEGTKVTGYRMVLYAFQVWAASLIFVPVADMGVVYLITAIAMGAMFTLFSFQVMINPTKKSAMRLFGFSISYITILFSLMAVDQLVRSGF